MNNKTCEGVINVTVSLSLSLSVLRSLCLLSSSSLQTLLTSLLFFFYFLISFPHTLFLSRLTVKPLSSQDRLWVGGLQIGVGGFRSEWVASDRRGVVGGRGGVGSRGVVGSHGWPWVLLLVGVSGWLEFQRCFNRVFGSLEFQRCFNGVSGWME